MNRSDLVEYWLNSANIDHKAMKHLFEKGDFHWALFMGHLVIEKLLKANFVKAKDNNPPFIHNLSRIAELAGIDATYNQLDALDTITTFNIRARYDDYKQLFYKKCTLEYTQYWITEIEEIVKWLKQKLSK